MNQKSRRAIMDELYEYNAFWSYQIPDNYESDDDIVIEKTLVYLDLDSISKLFTVYLSKRKNKESLERKVVIAGTLQA